MIGSFDAAVIDKENGKPHIVKRMDRPRIHVIPEQLGGGTLPRKELKEAAGELTASQAGLIAVGEPTIEKGIDKALNTADKVVKRTVDASADEITSELQEASKLAGRAIARTNVPTAAIACTAARFPDGLEVAEEGPMPRFLVR